MTMNHETLRGQNAGLRPGKMPGSFYGTSRQSFLERAVTRAKLEAVFGAPTNDYGDCPMDDKVYAEWYIRFANGTVASVYDYRSEGDYRVGAFEDGQDATALVREALGLPPQETK